METNLTPFFGRNNPKTGEITRFKTLLQATGKTEEEIAELAGCAGRTLHNHIYGNQPLSGKVSLDWLLSDAAPMWVGATVREVREESPAGYGAGNAREARIQAFLREWFRTRGEDDQAWLEVQLRRAVPEYEVFAAKLRG